MIARHIIFFLIILLLPDLYFYVRYLRRTRRGRWVKWMVMSVPTVAMLVYTAILYFQPHFQPDNPDILEVYLWLIGLVVVPKAVYALCSILGHVLRRLTHRRRNYGNLVGILAALGCVYITIYGFTVGVRQLEVKQVDLYFADLPKAYDGYRIALFSDLHVGSYRGSRQQVLHRALHTLQQQKANLIVFAGDLQNLRPQEIYPYRHLLAALKATDGVVSVLGNHDYAEYIHADSNIVRANEQETQRLQRQMGWQLLKNEHIVLHRGKNDSIVVVGLDDNGNITEHKRADIEKAMTGIEGTPFTIVVEHEPPTWRDLILPQSHAQLTLSGHTHGGQIALFGFTPLKWIRKEIHGLYEDNGRYLYVTSGIGGLIPLRFGVPPEIVTITLHRKK